MGALLQDTAAIALDTKRPQPMSEAATVLISRRSRLLITSVNHRTCERFKTLTQIADFAALVRGAGARLVGGERCI